MKEAVHNESISVVLPNYNGKHLLEKNLPALIKSIDAFEHEIIIVDDNSTDDSIAFLKATYPNIRIIESKINNGFSITCNKGIKAAAKNYICISNTDVTFTEDYFRNALENFTSPEVFAVKGDIINYRDNFDNILNTERTSLLYYKRGFLRFNQKIEPSGIKFTSQINSQFVLLGCCFVCRSEALKELGGYDEIYSPFYWEDADLAQRALTKGYTLVYDNRCKVYHEVSATISNNVSNVKRRLVSNRNKFIFTWRHLSGTTNWLSHIFHTTLNLLTRWITLDWKYYVAFLTALRSIIRNKYSG